MKQLLMEHIEEKGMVALDAKIFYEIIRRLPDNDVTIKQTEKFQQRLPVKKQNSQFLANQEKILHIYPVIEKDEPLTLSQYTLKEMIQTDHFFYCC